MQKQKVCEKKYKNVCRKYFEIIFDLSKYIEREYILFEFFIIGCAFRIYADFHAF